MTQRKKTYIVAIVDCPQAICGLTVDFELFDSLHEFTEFCKGKPAFNYLDDTARLRTDRGEKIIRSYCILANNYMQANERAWALRQQYC